MKKTFLVLLIAAALVGQLSAGGGSEEVVEQAAGATFEGLMNIDRSGWEIGSKGGSFVMSTLGDPKSFNLTVAAETSTTDVMYRVYSPLIRRNQLTMEWEPAVAESYQMSDDELTLTVKVRKGMKWSDGDDLTAEDFVFTVNQLDLREDVASNSRDGLMVDGQPIKVSLVDKYTLTISTPSIWAGIYEIANIYPAPMHIFADVIGWDESKGYDYEWEWGTKTDDEGKSYKAVIEKKPAGVNYAAINSFWGVDVDVTKVVGNGPFTIAEYLPAQKIVFAKNKNYWEKDEKGHALPYLDEVVFLIVEDQDTALAKFQAGELDALGLRGEDYAVLIDGKEAGGYQMYSIGPSSSTEFITMNQNFDTVPEPIVTWTNNLAFREALAHLVDRQTIINNVAYGFGYPQYTFVPRFSPFYWEGADDEALKFDPEAAKAKLDSIGYIDRDGDGWREDPDGNKITLRMTTNSGNTVRESIGEIFSQEARAVGIEVNFQPEDFNTMVGKLLSGNDWDIILIGLTGSIDPIDGSNVYQSSGNLHMIQPNQPSPVREWEAAADKAFIAANATTDEAERRAGWVELQKIWMNNLPWIYTFNSALMGAYSTEFGNIKPQPVSYYGVGNCLSRIYLK
ncbi:MAG: hypothetical protein CSA76_03550 [Spirochaetales bacterium]|nr:MAG: hypothetical protein CSA76_03550 [Spirochaetales bacterium]